MLTIATSLGLPQKNYINCGRVAAQFSLYPTLTPVTKPMFTNFYTVYHINN